MEIFLAASAVGGFVLGLLLFFFIQRPHKIYLEARIQELHRDILSHKEKTKALEEENKDLYQNQGKLETLLCQEKKANQEKIALLQEAKESLGHLFQSLSNEALKQNNESFLTLAQSILSQYQSQAQSILSQKEESVHSMVFPIKDSLHRLSYQVDELEKARLRAYSSLVEQIKSLNMNNEKLQSETGNLVKALRMPIVRGRWGEIQLKRVVEIAGMLDHCDFSEQQSVTTETGRLRPDLIIHLPGDKYIVVDAKAPLQAYLDAIESTDDQVRLVKFKEHSRQIRSHISNLSAKSYWEQFQPSPEFVVLFLPGESFFSAALEQDSSLIEDGVQQQVILATPTTLISLLRAVHYGWRQERIAANAQQISELGQELYERIGVMVDHLNKIGLFLGKSVEAFNSSVSSFDARILPCARKFKELGIGSKKEIESIPTIDKNIRFLCGTQPDIKETAEQKQFLFDEWPQNES
ncbi:MAG: DNA recombination protein RmuC [Candidatus Brocadiae bacterium]|nr:DNA recombination protein RmuC [Candidatus Brocadiia bacterium]